MTAQVEITAASPKLLLLQMMYRPAQDLARQSP